MVWIVYIGNEFYFPSGTIMSSIYEYDPIWDNWIRSDWGQIERKLTNGEEVHIRPATDEELGMFRRRLEQLKIENKWIQNIDSTTKRAL